LIYPEPVTCCSLFRSPVEFCKYKELISKVLAFFVNFTFDRAVEPFYGITFGFFFAKKA